jgi:DNA topoisomerase-1
VQTTPEALDDARKVIGLRFGGGYVPAEARLYKTKAKNAQEAHEAIRPTSMVRHPGSVKLESDMQRLYELIWRRMIASQMEAARIESTTVDMETADGRTGLRATGQVVLFDGYLAVYQEGRDDSAEEDDARLPAVSEGNPADVHAARADQHFTEPPPRFTEATLVKKMEELGIGRPSTYASILSVLRDRQYVRMDKNRFIPEDKGRLVTAFLEEFFRRYVEYDFTAGLEEQLDQVSAGALDWKTLLRDFWRDFHPTVEGMGEIRTSQVLDALNETLGPVIFPAKGDGSDPRLCPTCSQGQLSLKTSRFGAFIGCSRYPECRYTRQLGAADGDGEQAGDRELGTDPETGQVVWLKSGRFGPYVQLGEAAGKDDKPKRSSLPKGLAAADVDLEKALRLLRLPREVGKHPEDGEPILAGIGRYGPFVQHGKTYANLSDAEEVFEVGLNRAVALIAEKRSGGGGRGRASTQPLKELGVHPVTGEALVVMPGRYGEYIKAGKVNVTLPKGADVDSLTLDQAVRLVDAKAGLDAVPKAGKAPARRAAAKPAGRAKPAARTPAKGRPGGGAAKPPLRRATAAPAAPDEEPPF